MALYLFEIRISFINAPFHTQTSPLFDKRFYILQLSLGNGLILKKTKFTLLKRIKYFVKFQKIIIFFGNNLK